MKPENTETSTTRRDRLNILIEILCIAKRGAPKTRIMYQANMSFAGINEYLPILLRSRLLTQNLEGKKTIYQSTDKGIAVLNLYSQLTELINENDDLTNQIKSPPLYMLAQH